MNQSPHCLSSCHRRKLNAYEHSTAILSVGVITDVDIVIFETEELLELHPNVSISLVRRHGKSQYGHLTFNDTIRPRHLYAGKGRCSVNVYEDWFTVKEMWPHWLRSSCSNKKQICLRCTNNHLMDACDTPTSICVNCGWQRDFYFKVERCTRKLWLIFNILRNYTMHVYPLGPAWIQAPVSGLLFYSKVRVGLKQRA